MYEAQIVEIKAASRQMERRFPYISRILRNAADTIEELSAKVENLQFFADNISKLPGCNTCLKKNMCEFRPKYGEYCRINCPAWLGQPPKAEEGSE